MPDKIEFQNIKRQYPEFFREFPPELMEVISSDETSSKISDICLKNGVKNEKTVEGVAFHVISVLLGRLPQEILSRALVTNLKIDALTAKRISEEANQFIFSQAPQPQPQPELQPPIEKVIPSTKEPPKESYTPPKKDTYKEQI